MRNTILALIGAGACALAAGTNAEKIGWKNFTEPFVSTAHAQEVDWPRVNEILGRSPPASGDVHRYGFPRSDLNVTLDGVTIKPALALGGWVAFKPAHGGVMAMGDLVLLESEINPVMTKLIEGGLEITAVHNHLLRANPATFYMHVGGHGDPVKMATAIRDALAASNTPLTAANQTAGTAPPTVDLDTAQLDQIIGAKGKPNGGVYAFCRAAPRSRQRRRHAANPGRAVGRCDRHQLPADRRRQGRHHRRLRADRRRGQSGDQALRTNGIEVTALHSHMLDEQPRLFFMHFWANDDAIKLAKGLRAALDKTARAKS